MKRFRDLVLLTTLLATATAAHAQSPRFIPLFGPYQAPTEQRTLEGTAQSAGFDCDMAQPVWFVQALQQTASTWQRLRSLCSANPQAAGCCEPACAKAAGCALGVAGNVKSCATAQATKACACVKACACCESCKEKKEASAGVQDARRAYCPRATAQVGAPSMPTIGIPPACGSGIVQILPVPGIRVIHVVQVAQQTRPVHLVTPDLEAHCERMHHQGDTVILEGNVLLLCKKHALPMRIEAQRVAVNMRDGSFHVDSMVRQMPVSSFGVQRTSAVEMMPIPMNTDCIRAEHIRPGQPMNPGAERTREIQRSGSPRDIEALFRLLIETGR
jgi:hypothetical protein